MAAQVKVRAVSPTGSPIKGTLEYLTAVALIEEFSWDTNSEGKITFEHNGETEVDWDSETTVQRNFLDVFVDEDGAEWSANQIELVDINGEDE